MSDGEERSTSSEEVYRFSCGHPLVTSHGHRQRKQRAWPKYLGKRLPDVLSLKGDVPSEEVTVNREYYGQAVLIMFQPFRTLQDLHDEKESWWEAYVRKSAILESKEETCRILWNMQNYYESFKSSCVEDAVSEDEDGSDENMGEEDRENFLEEERSLICLDEMSVPMRESNPFLVSLGEFVRSPMMLSAIPNMVRVINGDACRLAVTQMKSAQRKGFSTLIGQWNGSGNEFDINGFDACGEGSKKSVEVRVELLETILAALEMRSQRPNLNDTDAPTNLPINLPSLEEHANQWSLNTKQKKAFFICGAAILKHICAINAEGIPAIRIKQLANEIGAKVSRILKTSASIRMFVSGCGGTGKSRLIQTIVDFARRWNASSAVVVCAPSGIAATFVGGCTLHSLFGIQGKNRRRKYGRTKGPTQEEKEAWSNVCLVIVDEFSMVSPSLFDKMDARLRQLKNRADTPFGGTNLLLIGD